MIRKSTAGITDVFMQQISGSIYLLPALQRGTAVLMHRLTREQAPGPDGVTGPRRSGGHKFHRKKRNHVLCGTQVSRRAGGGLIS